MNTNSYPGTELQLFSKAKNWKTYWAKVIQPYIYGRVLEVGAGIGGSTLELSRNDYTSWTCIEPDPELSVQLQDNLDECKHTRQHKVIVGKLDELPADKEFDVILYIDVLEHIKDDRNEIKSAVTHLSEDGYLIVLVPAHQWLFSEFDQGIGHFRRYNAGSLSSLMPRFMKSCGLFYLDSVGLIASLANRLFLHDSMPSEKQIAFWNNILIPCSRFMDRLTFFYLGKSLAGIWQKKTDYIYNSN